MLALCTPAYFSEGPADEDWAVLAHRRSLGQARTGTTPQTVLPLIWEPVGRRLPGPVAEADTFGAGQPAQYHSLGLALMTMQAPRYRAALDAVLAAIASHMAASVRASEPAPPYAAAGPAHALPAALAVDDPAFTERFREELPRFLAPRVDRTLRQRGDEGTDTVVPAGLLPRLGRRILLVGPAGSGRSAELARLVAQALDAGDHAPWGCSVPFPLSAGSGALPPLDGLVTALAPAVSRDEPAGWAARQLRAGRAFLAVDDLDALPPRNRDAVWEPVLRLLRAHPQAPCVVATNGVGLPWERLGGTFRAVLLEPLEAPGVAALLDGLAPAGDDRAPLARLLAETEKDPVLRGVLGRPAAAASVWRTVREHGGTDMPPRHRLLRAAVTASWRRDPADEASAPPVVWHTGDQVPDSLLRSGAGGLAVATLDLDSAGIPVSTALAALRERIPAGRPGAADPERLLAALADRSGVLFGTGPDTVAFPDDAVRTFLAAHHLVARGPEADRIAAEQASGELAALLEDLRAAERPDRADTPDRRVTRALPTAGRPTRRLAAGPAPAARPRHRAVVRSRQELRALADEADGVPVPEVWCEGPVDGLEELLPRLPGLRTLVLSDNPALTSLPDLRNCRSLRTLRLLRCPALTDLGALRAAPVLFLTIDPWPGRARTEQLFGARWLSRADLVPGSDPPALARGGQTGFPEIRLRVAGRG
ncbi:NACHT domain-containing protein [Streptomyces sp. GC420]|uniref:NACHT domain-containing protein n=1 Tax=Streptomyces sp. GC420 TaxID=2697568 RepID=UPI0014151C27|nr:NACHT domain-containing protein [Streptomyces sp. GC420]NBM18772.1 large ATP-binding protein [Streptomyces sp. GC420]